MRNRFYFVETNGNNFVAVLDENGSGRMIETTDDEQPVTADYADKIANNCLDIGYMTAEEMDAELGTHESDAITEADIEDNAEEIKLPFTGDPILAEKNEQTSILLDEEDNTLVLFHKGMDLDDDNYRYLTVEEVVDYIDKAASWDAVDDDVWRKFCDELGINYDYFEYPEDLFDVIEERVAALK